MVRVGARVPIARRAVIVKIRVGQRQRALPRALLVNHGAIQAHERVPPERGARRVRRTRLRKDGALLRDPRAPQQPLVDGRRRQLLNAVHEVGRAAKPRLLLRQVRPHDADHLVGREIRRVHDRVLRHLPVGPRAANFSGQHQVAERRERSVGGGARPQSGSIVEIDGLGRRLLVAAVKEGLGAGECNAARPRVACGFWMR